MSSKNFYGLTGDVTIDGGSLLVSNAATLGTTKTFVVTVDNSKYVIDGGDPQASLELHEGQTYIFDVTVANAGSHPFKISETQEAGQPYQNGVEGYNTNYIKFTVPFGAPTILYYYCQSHTGMGGQINISSAAELVVSGRIVASGNVEASKITASANVEVTGNVVASKFVGDGSLLTNVTGATTSGLQTVTDNSPITTNTIQFTNPTTSLRASGNVVATGNVTADHFIGDGSQLSGIVTSVSLEAAVNTANTTSNTVQFTNTSTSLTASGNVEVAGNVVVSGNVEAAYFVGDGSKLSGIVTSVTLDDAVNAANTTSNTVQFTNTSTSLTASGNVEVTGNVIAGYFIGDGSGLTNLPGGSGGSGTSHWTKNAVTNQLHYNAGSVGVSNTNPAHDLSVGSNLYVDDDATDGVLMVTGNVHGTYFVGDGSRLINLPEGGGSTNWTTSGNPVNKIYYPQNPGTTSVSVGIMNAAPTHTLSVGSNLFVDDAGSNVLHVDGNITAESMFLGALGIKPSYPLDSVTDAGNVTPHIVSFTNPTLGIITASNVEIGGELVIGKGTLGGSNLEVGEANLFVNTDLTRVGIATNQPAATLHVNGSLEVDGPLTFGIVNVAAQHGLEAITAVSNTTPLTIELQNADTSLVTTGNVEVGGKVTTNSDLTVAGNVFYKKNQAMTINVDSNVVTEYTGPHDRPLRKYPEVALTQNDESATSGYVASGSSIYSASFEYYEAFDLKTNLVDVSPDQGSHGAWISSSSRFDSNGDANLTTSNIFPGTSYRGEYCALKLPKAIKLDNFHIFPRGDATTYVSSQAPKDLRIFGSNDGTTWTHIKQFQNLGFTGRSGLRLHVNDSNTYNEYAFFVEKITILGTATYCAIGGIELYGHEEGSGSLDTTFKSVYNVPATTGTQLDVYYDGQDYGPSVPTSITDKTGNGNNTTTVGSGIGFDSTYKAFTFDGTSNGKIVGTHDFSGDASPVLTMSFWMKRTAVMGSYDYIATIGTAATGQMIGLTTNPNNQFNFGNYGDGVITDESILLDQWYHVTLVANGEATFNSTNFKPYINGKEPKLSSYGGDSTTTLTGTQLTLGTNTNSAEAFNGSIANFRLYSKALNAEQIQELYDYQKDYFLGSKSQVTLYKGHLGVGVTEPSGQLELAGDERIQMYPPRDLDQYDTNIEGHGVFCVSASNEYWDGNHPAWEAFSDNHINTSDESVWTTDDLYDASTGLHDGSTTTAGIKGEWIQLKTPYKIKISSFDLNSYIDSASNRQPRDFILLGSNDGNVWEQMKSVAGQTSGYTMPGPWNTSPAGPHHIVNSTKYYSYFRIVVTANQGDNLVGISRIRFYGTPGPTTLDKGSLTLGRSLDVPRISRYDVDTETPRPEKLLVDFDTTVNSSPTDISGKGNHGTFNGDADYSAADKAFDFPNDGATGSENVKITAVSPISASTDIDHSFSIWVKVDTASTSAWRCIWEMGDRNYYKHFGLYIPGPSATVARGRHQFSFETWGQGYYPSGETVEANRWYHIVGTYDKDTRTKALYIDGVYKNGGAITTGAYSSGPANPPLTIGSHLTGGETWAGQVSSFKAYKGVTLEPSEVRKLYNLGRTGRSMVISDTAVGIGKAPEANLDVRGVAKFRGAIGYGNQPSTANDGNDYPDIFPASPLHIHQSTHPGQVEDEGIRFSHPANIGRWNLYISNNNHFRFAYNGGFKGWVDQSDSNAQMNGNFTGQHRTFIKDVPFSRVSDLEGLIVSSDQNKYIKMSGGIETGSNAITTNESLPVVSLSNVVTDKRCFGVISASEDPDERTEQYGVFGSNFKKEKGDTRVYINSVGEGAIWVVNTIGSLEAGDYITTSNVAGYGQKQDDDVLHNYTVAKITMDCDFNPATQPIQVIRKDDNGDNVLDEHDQIQWEDHPTETEKAYKLRYLDANGNTTDEASAVHIAAFVGCTYHCG